MADVSRRRIHPALDPHIPRRLAGQDDFLRSTKRFMSDWTKLAKTSWRGSRRGQTVALHSARRVVDFWRSESHGTLTAGGDAADPAHFGPCGLAGSSETPHLETSPFDLTF